VGLGWGGLLLPVAVLDPGGLATSFLPAQTFVPGIGLGNVLAYFGWPGSAAGTAVMLLGLVGVTLWLATKTAPGGASPSALVAGALLSGLALSQGAGVEAAGAALVLGALAALGPGTGPAAAQG
jgi:hypothetical protein